jgi:tetratricopeptide (TPR) repeat protein
MNGAPQARAAVQLAQTALDRVGSEPAEAATAIAEAWTHAERALQLMAGTTALTGQDLLRELRQRELLTLGQAHAMVDFGAVAERCRTPHYTPASGDIDRARAAFDDLRDMVDGKGASRATPAATPTVATEAETLPHVPPTFASSRPNVLGRTMIGVAALAVFGAVGWWMWTLQQEPSDVRRGRAAYAAGDRLTAKNAFMAASGRYPALAEPLIYLGRMAREEGDLRTATENLRRAVALEPGNYLGHRELAGVLLASGRADLARTFYERAIRLNAEDRTSLGYMGCTLVRLGRPDVAQRFFARAGNGPWGACAAPPPVPQ